MPEFDERFFGDLAERHLQELSTMLANHDRKEPCPTSTTQNSSNESSEPL